ncbi:phage GP46 family protein [Rhizobium sp. RCAM05973]|uniref:phage GP46 family protein n=1 Tax=Rhizobium sp. RCAM05973 TaxID=2994066 RepID=UPI0022EBFD94|nr:phage GP46 family protein [Rhizobium sp. RCAM05973]
MSNIRIAPGQGTEAITLDWLTTGQNTLDSTHDLISAVLMAIGTDMRANADDELPVDGDADLRGWWGIPTPKKSGEAGKWVAAYGF